MSPFTVRIIRTPPKKTVSMRLAPLREGGVEIEVRAPRRVSEEFIASFVRERRGWIEKHAAKISRARSDDVAVLPELSHKETVKLFSVRYEAMLNAVGLGVMRAPRLSVRAMKSRWGSYRTGTHSIALNSALARTPLPLLDYVIAHELAHVAHHHHGPTFYAELERFLPDWQERKKMLRTYEHALLSGHATDA